jgi:hypothetical protein
MDAVHLLAAKDVYFYFDKMAISAENKKFSPLCCAI